MRRYLKHEASLDEDFEMVHLRRLSATMDNLRQSNYMTDVTLVCGQRRFPVHRVVLASASSYFHSRLKSEWNKQCEEHTVSDWNEDVIDSILSFAYTGRLTDAQIAGGKEMLAKVLEAADYFQIEDLAKYCFAKFKDMSSTLNDFWERYILAYRFSNQHEMADIIRQLSPHFDDVSDCERFLQLDKFQLRNILQHPDVDQSCMNQVFSALLKWTDFDYQRRRFSLKELLNILNIHWCPIWLNELMQKSIGATNSEMGNLLYEIYQSIGASMMCHQPLNESRKLVCFSNNTVHKYDVAKDEWLPTKQLPLNIDDTTTMVTYNNHILVFRGTGLEEGENNCTTVSQYCPVTNTVVGPRISELLHKVTSPAAIVFNNFIYIINGLNRTTNPLNIVQRYHPQAACHEVASTVKTHFNPFAFTFRNHLFVFGTTNFNYKNLELYDSDEDQWTELLNVSSFRDVDMSAFIGTKLFYISDNLYTLDILSLEERITSFDGRLDHVVALTSIEQNGKPLLVAINNDMVPYVYDIDNQRWVRKRQSTNVWSLNQSQILFHVI